MKELIQEKQFNDLEMQLVEAQKKLEDYEDELDKLTKANERLVKELSKALGWNQ
jgi:predicted DNA-binding ArsR family transcriptional regulator